MKAEEIRIPMPWGHIAAKAWGSPKDKPVLVVHGILDNAGSFDRLMPFLPHGYYYVCIDLPGHGSSTWFPKGMSLDNFHYVSVIRKVCDQLKWEKYYYIGHSFGALIGLIHSALYPEQIEKLISLDLDSPIPIANEELATCIRHLQDYTVKVTDDRNPGRLYTEEEVVRTLTYLRHGVLNEPAVKALAERAVIKVGDKYKFSRDPRLNVGAFAVLNNGQHAAILKEIKTPVLVIRSSQLALISNSPECAQIDQNDKKNCFVTVEGNHDVHNNSPEKVAPHICKFFSDSKSKL